MGDDPKKTAQTGAKETPPEAPAPEETRDEVSIKDGKVTMPESNYNALTGMKSDMLKYKERMAKAEAELEKLNEEKLETEKKQLEANQEFEALYKKAEAEATELKDRIQAQELDHALTTAALAAGIAKPEYVKLIDKSSIKRDGESGEISGIESTIKAFKESNPALFDSGDKTLEVDTGKGGKSTGVMTDDEVRAMTSKELMDAKKNNPDLWKRYTKLATHGHK